MPTYAYQCDVCDVAWEMTLSMAEAIETETARQPCPKCGDSCMQQIDIACINWAFTPTSKIPSKKEMYDGRRQRHADITAKWDKMKKDGWIPPNRPGMYKPHEVVDRQIEKNDWREKHQGRRPGSGLA